MQKSLKRGKVVPPPASNRIKEKFSVKNILLAFETAFQLKPVPHVAEFYGHSLKQFLTSIFLLNRMRSIIEMSGTPQSFWEFGIDLLR